MRIPAFVLISCQICSPYFILFQQVIGFQPSFPSKTGLLIFCKSVINFSLIPYYFYPGPILFQAHRLFKAITRIDFLMCQRWVPAIKTLVYGQSGPTRRYWRPYGIDSKSKEIQKPWRQAGSPENQGSCAEAETKVEERRRKLGWECIGAYHQIESGGLASNQ